jgi:hypothetical protein
MALNGAAVAVCHSTHAKDDIRGELAQRWEQARGKPIEVEIDGLQDFMANAAGDRIGQGAARSEREERGLVTGGGERVGEENRLAFRATAAEAILEDNNFHCPTHRPGDGVRFKP